MRSIAVCVSYLQRHGYGVVRRSVHGINQTRFYHFIVEKDGERWFCKVNRTAAVLALHLNSALVREFRDLPPGVRFLAPVAKLFWEDTVFHFYLFIDQRPVSNEAAAFKDFQVAEPDMDVFFGHVLDALACLARQDVITGNECKRYEPVRGSVVDTLRAVPPETPYGLEFLQYILREAPSLTEYSLAANDIQPQNMFWDEQAATLTLFDLEHLAPYPLYRDLAGFCASLWVVYDRSDYACRFSRTFFERLEPAERHKSYRYIRLHLTEITLRYYGDFMDESHRCRVTALMQWLRLELLAFVNTI